nr:MAG TPA: hypothetical protein [Caudoviricetes sp.]
MNYLTTMSLTEEMQDTAHWKNLKSYYSTNVL